MSNDNKPAAAQAEIPESVLDAVAAAIGSGVYYCNRTWSAWSYGTMGPGDFHPVADDGDHVAEIAQAAIAAMQEHAPVAAAPVDLRERIEALRVYAAGYYIRRDEVLAAIESTPAAPGIDPDVLEKAAIELWHRWGNDSVIEWEDESRKAEYRLAAEAVLALIDASPKGDDVADTLRLLLEERNHRTDGDLPTLAERCLHLSRGDRDLIAMRGTIIEKLQQRSPKGGSDERARFEAWVASLPTRLVDDCDEPYEMPIGLGAWEAWQAAKQASSAEVGAFICTGDELRCHDGNGCECAMHGLKPTSHGAGVSE